MKSVNNISEAYPDEIADRWVSEVTGLVSPPDICSRIFDLMQSPDSSASEFGEVISHDPNLTARLLKLVNSALYNFPNKIDTVSRAISIIGTRELYSLVVAVSAIKSFSNIPCSLANMDTFWRHSIFCGIIASNLGRRCNILHPERMFVAGLLHDIGSLVCFYQAPDVSSELIMIAQGDEDTLHKAERSEFGFSHADLGSKLLNSWNMPETVINAVLNHHSPANSEIKHKEAWIICLADSLANHSQLGALLEDAGGKSETDISAWNALGLPLKPGVEDKIIGDAGIQFTDVVSTLLPRSTRSRTTQSR